jgi:hypothetical protein
MLRRWARIRRYAVCRYARMQAAVNQEKEAMNDSILSGLALLADHKAHVEVRVSRPARYPAIRYPDDAGAPHSARSTWRCGFVCTCPRAM